MVDRTDRTRRNVLRTTAAAAGFGVFAGCTTLDEPNGDDESGNGDENGTEENGTENGDENGTGESDSYSVSMEPVGTVEFDSVPETWFSYTADYADMGVALGHGDGLSAIGIQNRYATHFYDELPDVSVEVEDLTELWQGSTDREVFYSLDADLHLIDPNFMINRLGWNEEYIDDIETDVAPFLGNTIFSGGYDWHEYTRYSLYEAFEKVAAVFQEQDRYQAFTDLHDEVLSDVESRLPEQTPDVAVLFPESLPPEAFYPYTIGSGTQSKQWNDLNVGRALAESDVDDFAASRGTIDYETLLEVDPDIIAIRQDDGVHDADFQSDIVEHMEDHPVASKLSAVQNGRVIDGGRIYQGPIINLFQLEQAAQDVYPDEFGDEQLFDRQRVSDIVNGNI